MGKTYRRIAAAIIGFAVMVLGLSACGLHMRSAYGASYYDSMCVDPYSGFRYLDTYCTYHPDYWYYVPVGFVAPAVGHTVVINKTYFVKPSGATIHTGGVSTTGGKAAKYTKGNTTTSRNYKPTNGKPRRADSHDSHGGSGGGFSSKKPSYKPKGTTRIGRSKTR